MSSVTANLPIQEFRAFVAEIKPLNARPAMPADDVSFNAAKFSNFMNAFKAGLPYHSADNASQFFANGQKQEYSSAMVTIALALKDFAAKTHRPVGALFNSLFKANIDDVLAAAQNNAATNDADAPALNSKLPRMAH